MVRKRVTERESHDEYADQLPHPATYQQRSKKTRDEFAAALASLVKEKPIRRITISDIAERANSNRQTFYYHFANINGLIFYLCERRFLEIFDEGDEGCTLSQLFLSIARQAAQSRELLERIDRSLSRQILSTALGEKALQVAVAQMDLLVDDPAISAEERHFAARYCLYGSRAVLETWLFDPGPESPEAIAAELTDAFMCQARGLNAGGGA